MVPNPWFWSKNGHFFNFFFQAILGRKMSFTIFQSGKTPFQVIKTRSSKSGKIDIFSNGLTNGFGPKMAIFSTFFLGNIGQKNVFYNILERKNAFLGYKNTKIKRSKNRHFSKGVDPWLWSKSAIFSTFFLRQYRPEKCLLRYSRVEKRLSSL